MTTDTSSTIGESQHKPKVSSFQATLPRLQGAGVRTRQGPSHWNQFEAFLNINAFFNGLSYVMTNVMAAAEPRAKYILLTDVVPVDEGRYKFHNRSDTCLLSPVIPQPFHF